MRLMNTVSTDVATESVQLLQCRERRGAPPYSQASIVYQFHSICRGKTARAVRLGVRSLERSLSLTRSRQISHALTETLHDDDESCPMSMSLMFMLDEKYFGSDLEMEWVVATVEGYDGE